MRAGKPLNDVGEMLIESDPIYGPAPSFDRERQVRKHIGDFTLFYAGMFPESINHYRLRRQRVESFVDWVKAGKESYYIVSKFEHFEYAKVAPLFAQLSQRFEQCVYGLNLVKNELEVMQHPIARREQRTHYVGIAEVRGQIAEVKTGASRSFGFYFCNLTSDL